MMTHTSHVLPSQRHLFDIPENVAYLNCAYLAPQLNGTRSTLLERVQRKSHPWTREPPHFFEDAEKFRQVASRALGGDVDGYAVAPSASYGLTTAARIMEPRLGRLDTMLIMAEEFPSAVLAWRRVAAQSGAALETIPTPSDGDWTRAILDRIRRGVKVVSLSPCHWTNGSHIDLAPIGRACRSVGSVLVVDATQTLGAIPFSIAEIQPDFIVAAGFKWMLSPYGFGLFYVHEKWRNERPLEETWQARLNAENFSGLVNYSDSYMPGARRFDMGQKGNEAILPGAIAALTQIADWGVGNIAVSLSTVNAKIASHLAHLGFSLPPESQRSAHMLGAEMPPGCQRNVIQALNAKNIYISQRGNFLRFSPHMHVTNADVDRVLAALSEVMA
jgi:selenocysteine lyase/cysteine desulfurase